MSTTGANGSRRSESDFESYSISGQGVRRHLFNSDGNINGNVNVQRRYSRSLHQSLLASGNAQQVRVDVHREEDDLPEELPGEQLANSTRGVGGGNQRSSLQNPPNVPGNPFEDLDEIQEDGARDVTPRHEYSTPSNVFYRTGTLAAGGFVPRGERHGADQPPEGVRPLRRTDELRDSVAELREKMAEMEIERQAQQGEMQRLLDSERQRREEAEKEKNEVRDLLAEAWADQNMQNNRAPGSAYLDLKGALQMVRCFAGQDSDKLDGFLKSVTSARELIYPEYQDSLLKGILGSKFEGTALKQLKYRTITSFQQLEEELRSLFGKAKSLVGLQAEFSRIQQKENESVSKYVARTEEATLDLLNGLLSLHVGFTEVEKVAAKTILMSLAKLMFEQGLRGQLQILVRAHNFKTLHESCAGAVDLEKTISGPQKGKHFEVPQRNSSGGNRVSMARQSTGNCFSCGQSGHIAKDCRNPQAGQRKSLPVASERRSVNAFGAVCKHCRYAGHEAADCRKLKKKLGISDSQRIPAELVKSHFAGKRNNNSGTDSSNLDPKRRVDKSDEGKIMPVGAYQVMMVKPTRQGGSFQGNKTTMIKPALQGEIKSQILLTALELELPTMFLADSGAKISLVRVDKLTEGVEISPRSRILRGISNHDVATLGEVILRLEIGNRCLGHTFQVVPANFPCLGGILGEDFLSSPTLKVETVHGKALVINGHPFELFQDQTPTKIGARSEVLLTVPTRSSGTGIVRKNQLAKGVFMGECLTKAVKGQVLVCVVNTNDNDVFINPPTVKLESLPSGEIIMMLRDAERGEVKDRIKLLRENLRIEHLNQEEKYSLLEILEEYNSIVQLPGDPPGATDHLKHEIPLKPGTAPINVRPHRLPESQMEEVDHQVKEMLQNGIVRPSKSQWNAPLLVVPKKMDASGKVKFRVVVDFRRLNEVTVGDSFPLPNISDILDRLGNAKYFSTLDLASGFHQIPVREEDRCKTAFSTPYGHYEFCRLPFGVKGGPATFQRLMNSVLAGVQGIRCFVYLDDIVIFGPDLQEHNKRLREVLQCLKEANLRLQPDKCNFLRKEVVYLGHIITKDGIKADPSKIEAVVKFPVPQHEKEIMSFLGLAGYYRKFIRDFSKIAKPLSELLKKDIT
ncbi:uncharacterized protein LOC135168161 [Diachasmimorpha longicaudata]|uniref:uncharacterized protein LOC135168160 n=1 Tax=Diachasmimorpha longicaudata TaxID=58733 RepID=UPI0030B8BEA2